MTHFLLLALLGLAACENGGEDCDNCTGTVDTASCEGCGDDTESDPEATATFTGPQVDFLGTIESSTSNLAGKNGANYTVTSGMEVTVKIDTYSVTFGDVSLATEASDWLPIHTATDGSKAIAPASVVTVIEGDELTLEAPIMNLYVEGTWTCNLAGSTNSSTAQSSSVSYINGSEIALPNGNLVVDGNTVHSPASDCLELYGAFINSTQLAFHVGCLEGDDANYQCWHGQPSDRPDVW